MSRRKSMLTNVEVARPQRSSTAEIKGVLVLYSTCVCVHSSRGHP